MPHAVTCFLRHRTSVLLGRRSDAPGTDAGHWAAVSRRVEGDPTAAEARRTIGEETGVEDPTLVRVGDPVEMRDGDRTWTVHPFLFAVGSRTVDPNGFAAHEWASPPVIRDRLTVPGLWDAYAAVAPTVETVVEDTAHGSAWLSVRALDVLRDRAAVADSIGPVNATARALRDARPSMAAVANRVNRVMATAEWTPEAVRERAAAVAEAALDADDGAALAGELAGYDAVLVGADAVLADWSVVNKVGTRGAALAAAREGIPVYVVAAADKMRPDERFVGERGAATDLYEGSAPVDADLSVSIADD
jgi:ADP-ribose pyrophosphatase YjhB (NUDIX family)